MISNSSPHHYPIMNVRVEHGITIEVCKDYNSGNLFQLYRTDNALFQQSVAVWLALAAHPQVLTPYSLERFGADYILVTDYVGNEEGVSQLAAVLKKGPAPIRLIVHVALSVIRLLRAIQQVSPLCSHGALSPETIFLKPNDEIKIGSLGFGALQTLERHRTSAGLFIEVYRGAVTREQFLTEFNRINPLLQGYQAPEYSIAPTLVSIKSDLYSLGILMAEMLGGEASSNPPDLKKLSDENVASRRYTVANDSLQAISKLAELARSFLAPWPEERPTNLFEIEVQLAGLLEESAINTLPPFSVNEQSLQGRALVAAHAQQWPVAIECLDQLRKQYPWSDAVPSTTSSLVRIFGRKKMEGEWRKEIFHSARAPIFALLAIFACIFGWKFLSLNEFIVYLAILIFLAIQSFVQRRVPARDEVRMFKSSWWLLAIAVVYWLAGRGGFSSSPTDSILAGLGLPVALYLINDLVTRIRGSEFISQSTVKVSAVVGAVCGMTGMVVVSVALIGKFLVLLWSAIEARQRGFLELVAGKYQVRPSVYLSRLPGVFFIFVTALLLLPLLPLWL